MKYFKLTKECEFCGIKYSRKPTDHIGNFKRNKTCSKKCRYARLEKDTMHIDDWGYLRFNRTKQRYHRYVMEQHLGRKLRSDEEVHHIDENKLNNSIENLTILSKSEHTRITFLGKKRPDTWRIAKGYKPLCA